MKKMVEIFDRWNLKKQQISLQSKQISFKEREIFFIKICQNIGVETNGKGEEFLRPVLVYKKFNNSMFLGIPLSTKFKEGRFYYNFKYKADVTSIAVLSQVKVFDAKRLKYKSGVISKDDFIKLHLKLLKLITPQEIEGSPEGINMKELYHKKEIVANDK